MPSSPRLTNQATLLTIQLGIMAIFSPYVRAEIPKAPPDPPRIKSYPYGYIAMTSLRLYVSPPYRPMCAKLYKGKVNQALPEIKDAYKANPTSQELYVIRSQADADFRRQEFKHYQDMKADKMTTDDHFRRGVNLLSLSHEWLYAMPIGKAQTVYNDAATDLEYCWLKKPTVMVGAVLLDTYGATFSTLRSKAIPFTEEFLRFVDPKSAYPALVEAKARKFTDTPATLDGLTTQQAWLVTAILGERWCLLKLAPKNHLAEIQVLEKWWRDLSKQIPKPTEV